MKNKLLVVILACVLLISSGCGEKAPVLPGKTQPTVPTTIPEETVEQTEEVTTTEPTVPAVAGIEGTALYNADKFALVLTDLSQTEEGSVMTVTAVNRTDMTVYMRLMNFSVNSFMLDVRPTVVLEPQQTLEAPYLLTQQELTYNGITDITDLQFDLWVYDSDDFKTPDVADGLCKYYPYGAKGVKTYERQPQPEDLVLVDNDRFTVTVTEVVAQDQITLKLHLKNKSDKELLFIAPYSALDGAVIDPLWAHNVSAGKQLNSQITYTAKQLREAGVQEPAVLELPVQIGDHEDWSAGVYFFEVYTITLAEEPVEEQVEAPAEETT